MQVLTETVNLRDYIKKMFKRAPELSFQMSVDDYRRPCYSDKRIESRMKYIRTRNELTNEWKRSGVAEQKDFAVLTNILIKAWSGMTTGQYKTYTRA